MRNRILAAILVVLAAATPSGAAESRPNLLFCIADDASWPHMGAYGCRWTETPAFDRVAREGLLFHRAYTPNAKCAPSRACILTGRNSWQLGPACNHICFYPPEFKSYVEALGESGYHTGRTAKGWAPGVAVDVSGKPRQMAGQAYNRRKADPPTSGINRIDYAANFRDFLDACPEDRPWCFWYGSLEPHRGYEFGSGRAKAGKKLADIDQVPPFWPDTEAVRDDMLDYAMEIEHFDRHLGRMIAELEQRGMLDNTLVVVTSDNGMPFPRVKGQEYELSNHLPLAIMWKDGIVDPGRDIQDYVSFIDFAPTFLDVAGVDWREAGMQPAAGRSLRGLLRNEADASPHRTHVLIGKERHDIGRPHDQGYPIRGIVRDGYLLIRNFEPQRWPAGNPETGYLNCDGSPTKTLLLNLRREGRDDSFWQLAFGRRPEIELYHVATDPVCLNNLAEDPGHAERRLKMTALMERELRDQRDPRMLGRGGEFEAYPYAARATAGFYEKHQRGETPRAGWVNPSDFEEAPIR